jgi:hypothetical protein
MNRSSKAAAAIEQPTTLKISLWWILSGVLAISIAIWCGNGSGAGYAMHWLFVGLLCSTLGLWVGENEALNNAGKVLATLLLLGSTSLTFLQPPAIYLQQGAVATYPWWTFLKTAALLTGGACWFVEGREAKWLYRTAIALTLASICWVIMNSPSPAIDVVQFFRKSTEVVIGGSNPYAASMPNIYGTDTRLYSPSLINGDHLNFGFPYPLVTLVLGCAGQIFLGDYRFLFALVFAAGLLFFGNSSDRARLAAICILLNPRLEFFFEQGWTDSLTPGLLGLALGALSISSRAADILLAIWIGSKPYLIPFAGLRLPERGDQKNVLLLWGGVVALYAIPLFMGPKAYLWSAFQIQFVQPVRTDSLSFLFAPTPVLIGALLVWVAGLIALVRRPALLFCDPDRRLLMLGWLLFAFFAFNKQAFANYYFSLLTILAFASILPFNKKPSRQ